jgi:hypothetical protein
MEATARLGSKGKGCHGPATHPQASYDCAMQRNLVQALALASHSRKRLRATA